MKKTPIMLAGLIVLFLAIVVYSLLKDPHQFAKSECSTCHMMSPSGQVQGRKMAAPIPVLCRRCHENIFTTGHMHPFNVKPQAVVIPADMPLDQYGLLSCATCHDIHSSYFTPYGAPSHFLRRYSSKQTFCETCHPRNRSGGRGHKETFGEAHVGAAKKYRTLDSSQAIDTVSQKCVYCHDGTVATNVKIGSGVWTHNNPLMRFDRGEHPIGVDYESARLSNRKAFLRPMALVDRRIQFFDGKVGCGSCHSPYSNTGKGLVMSDRESRLCLACHIMDSGLGA